MKEDIMVCECDDCKFRGMELCEHRKLMDEINRLRNKVRELNATIHEAGDRMRYYFGTFDGKFSLPQMQNVYDVLFRDDEKEQERPQEMRCLKKEKTPGVFDGIHLLPDDETLIIINPSGTFRVVVSNEGADGFKIDRQSKEWVSQDSKENT